MVVEDLIDSRKPASRSRQYRGFVLHYSRGNFIIDGVRGGRIWEEKISDRIVAELTKAATPTFLDVGTNIGVMTLNVLAGVPSAWIHAFEPGPRPAKAAGENDRWHAAGCPPVSVIKVDSEGAELWVLQGGAGLLDACQPSLFLELQPANLRCYPHSVYESSAG